MLINLFLLLSLLNSGNLSAQNADQTLKDVYSLLALDSQGLSNVTSIHKKNKEEIKEDEKQLKDEKSGNIKGDYLASTINCAGSGLQQCAINDGQDFKRFMSLMKYDAKIKVAHKLEQQNSEKINSVKKKVASYVSDKDIEVGTESYTVAQDLINARLNLAKAEFELLKFDNAEMRSTFVKEEGQTSKTKGQLEKDRENAQKEFNSKITELSNNQFADDIDKTKSAEEKTNQIKKVRKKIIAALSSTETDLEVSGVDVTADDIFSSLPDGLEICKSYSKKSEKDKKTCEELAAKYNLAAITGGSAWSPIKRTTDENCGVFTNLGANGWNTIMGFLATKQSLEFQKCSDDKGLDDPSCIKKATGLSDFFGDPMKLAAVYNQTENSNANTSSVKINPSFTVAGTQTSPSMGIGGTLPSNPFSAFASSSVTTAAGTGPAGSGSNNRVNASTGANILNSISTKYTGFSSGATSFYNQYSDYTNNLTNNNKTLLTAFGKGVDPTIYQARAASVQNTLDKAKGGEVRYPGTTSYASTIDLRQKITELNQEKADLVQSLTDKLVNGGLARYKLKYGSLAEKQQATAELALSNGYTDYVKMKIGAIDSEISLYYSNSSALLQNTSTQLFDTSTMYASNNNDVYPRKSLSLKKLKTPISQTIYVLNEGWEEQFKKYISDMMNKAEESKKKMNLLKADIKNILAQSLPIVPLKKIPNLVSTAYEIKNMESIETVAKKNMAAIDKAMLYHKERKQGTPPDLYAQYEKDASALKSSMQNVVGSIDSAKPNVEKSYTLINQMYVEVPKAEALREIAKKMVAQGL
ncbi:MAG: hypothetical protein WCQ47_04045 [bacterium]